MTSERLAMPAEERERVRGLLEGARWVFARTMPKSPHFYTLRREWDDAAFVSVVEAIRLHGYVEVYKGRKYVMLNVNGWKHWTMGAPVPKTILINRKRLEVEADGGAGAVQ